jgi:hypothetical protein
MTKVFRNLALLLAGLLTVSMLAGCGEDTYVGLAAANFLYAVPPSGSTIAANASIFLIFDNAPADVTASAGVAMTTGKTVIVAGPFTPGPLRLTITWIDGTRHSTITLPRLVAHSRISRVALSKTVTRMLIPNLSIATGRL